MQQQKIGADSVFAIYGAATTGAIIYRNLVQQGLQVGCFIDRRYAEIDSYFDVPVLSVEEFAQKFDKNTIVIVAVKNVFAHENIVCRFIEYGYYIVVYKSKNLIKNMAGLHDQILGKVYDAVFDGSMIRGCEIPLTHKIGFETFEDDTYVEMEDEYIRAKIPAAFVFSDKYEDKSIIWNSVNMMGLVPHLDFFSCIQGQKDHIYEDYMIYCHQAAQRSGGIVTSDKWEEGVLENRIDIYYNMELERQFHPEFFDSSAPLATLNENCTFNIHSGKHRMVYQIVNGTLFLPLKLRKREYVLWRNEAVAHSIFRYLEENNIRSLAVPIMNPYFYKFPCDNMMFYYEMQKNIVNFIYRYFYVKKDFEFEKYIVYNNGTQGLILNPVLMKMGFKVYSEECRLEQSEELTQMLNRLYGVQCEDCHVIEACKSAQVVITDKEEGRQRYKKCELLFMIQDFEEGLADIEGFKDSYVISAGFCNNKRKKVSVWVKGDKKER